MAYNALTATFAQFKIENRNIVKAAGKLQDRIHAQCVAAAIQWLKHDNPDWGKDIVEKLNPLGGTLRVQAVMYWFTNAVGLKVEVDSKTGAISAKKNKAFDWNKDKVDILNYGKANPYYDLAPSEKPLTQPDPKVDALAVIIARAKLLGLMDDADITKLVNEIPAAVAKKEKDAKVLDWTKRYQEQQQAA